MVHYLRELAAAYSALGQPKERSQEMLEIAANISNAVNAHLWADAENGDDHYITQLNHDGTTADYIDYAANAMAIWQGVADKQRAQKIVERIAKGNCTGAGARGTWVSERPFYEFDADKVAPDKQVYSPPPMRLDCLLGCSSGCCCSCLLMRKDCRRSVDVMPSCLVLCDLRVDFRSCKATLPQPKAVWH